MKKKYKIIGYLSFLGFLAWIFFPNSIPTGQQKFSIKQEITSFSNMERKVTSKEVNEEGKFLKDKKTIPRIMENKRIPANRRENFFKYSQSDPFDAYPKTLISRRYAVINGLVVSFQKTSSAIRSIGGLHYYEEGQFQEGHVVVYDKSQEKYAMWSGEVIIEASDKHLEELLGKFDMEVVSKSPGRIIIKAGPDFNLSTDLQSVEKSIGIDSLSLDLKYSKLMRQ